ncbi:MAG: hypothetical protein A2Y17_01760 [Clostridiales bacterium GWF2_38_85]|nr:MAG: hypothetical protein A2Y17_01760 [Clostridiales bacterium GWF2_38_85]HBL84764.1 sodium:solute symporter [Clostridiales bacterium]
MAQTIAIISLIVFSLGMVLIGLYSRKKAETLDGFLLGGRKMGPWISAFAYGTSYFSAVIFIGYAGQFGWRFGVSAIWIGIGNALIGALLAWKILAKRTRSMTRKLEAKTMPEFFARRYNSTGMKIYAAAIIFIFLLPYAASVYKGLGSLFSTIFTGAQDWVVMLIVALLTAVYLVLGGYVATALNDLIQGLIMIVGIIVMIAILFAQPEVGGVTGWISKLSEINPDLSSIWGGNFNTLKFLATNIILTSFGVWGLPQMIHKYYTVKDNSAIKKGAVISTLFALITGCGAYLVGSMGRLFVQAAENGKPDVVNGFDGVVPAMLFKVFSENLLLNVLLSIILLLLLSASMSTLAAVVLTSSTAISVDVVSVVKKNPDEKKQMLLTRGLCLLFVLLSYLFATANISFIVNLMSFSWGVVAGSFIGPMLWGLYWKGTTKAGAWAGVLSGATIVIGLIAITTSINGFDVAKSLSPEFGVTAMIVSIIIVPIVSLLTKKFSEEHIQFVFKSN